jgi:DNA-directed RNA polymerase specialized sigma24 family protein
VLEELSKKDKIWRKMAFSICKCHTLADDLVHDMYLKLSEYNKPVNDYYVYYAIKHIYLSYIKNNKEVPLNALYFTKDNSDIELLELRKEIDQALNKMTLFEREILLHTHEKSLRECELETGVAYGVFNYHKNKLLPKLKKIYNGKTKR